MAGTFGYEAGHYDISMQMAEVSLLPAVRKVPNAIVVADGTRFTMVRSGKHCMWRGCSNDNSP
jgi:hypothetical protein